MSPKTALIAIVYRVEHESGEALVDQVTRMDKHVREVLDIQGSFDEEDYVAMYVGTFAIKGVMNGD